MSTFLCGHKHFSFCVPVFGQCIHLNAPPHPPVSFALDCGSEVLLVIWILYLAALPLALRLEVVESSWLKRVAARAASQSTLQDHKLHYKQNGEDVGEDWALAPTSGGQLDHRIGNKTKGNTIGDTKGQGDSDHGEECG